MRNLLHERGIDISHETVRFRWNRFGPMFAAEIRRKRAQSMRSVSRWQWHPDDVFATINGKWHYLWRAVDHEGEVLENVVAKRRDKRAALKFLRKLSCGTFVGGDVGTLGNVGLFFADLQRCPRWGFHCHIAIGPAASRSISWRKVG